MRATAAQRLDRLPESSFHRRLAMMIGLGLFFDAFDLYLAGGVMVALNHSAFGNTASNAQFASAGAFGALVGACLAGWLGDRFGRRFSFQANLALFGAMSIAAALAPSMGWLIAARFLMGIGLGAEIVVGYSTISEFAPPAARGRWGAILFFVATSALPVSNLMGYLIIPAFGWRWMFAIAGVGGLVVWYLRKKMPESPRWLESVGRVDEADAVLDAIEAEVERDLGRPLPPPAIIRPPAELAQRFSDLWRPPILRSTIVGMTLNVISLSGLYGFIIWLPTFLVKQGVSLPSSLGLSTLMAAGSLLGVGAAGRVADRMSRKKGIAAMSVVTAILGLAYPFGGTVVVTTLIGVLLIASFYFVSTIGFSTYVPEIFPTALRLRGAGVCSMAGRAAAVAAPQACAALFSSGGVGAVTGALSAMLVVQALIIALFGVETTGRSLDAGLLDPRGDDSVRPGQAVIADLHDRAA